MDPKNSANGEFVRSIVKTQYTIPVTLSADDPTVYHVVGWLFSFTTNTYSSLVTVPLLIANGSDDKIFSANVPFNLSDPKSVKSFEATFFSAVPSLSVFVLENAGHCINLHLNAHAWFEAARAWSDQYVGSNR